MEQNNSEINKDFLIDNKDNKNSNKTLLNKKNESEKNKIKNLNSEESNNYNFSVAADKIIHNILNEKNKEKEKEEKEKKILLKIYKNFNKKGTPSFPNSRKTTNI